MSHFKDLDLQAIAEHIESYLILTSDQRKGYESPFSYLPVDRFLPHAVATFSEFAKPVKNEENGLYSASKTIAQLPADLKHLLKIIYISPRSSLMKGTMTSQPRFGGLTPIFLWAMKDMYQIKYTSWDRNDPQIKYLLSRQQEELLLPCPRLTLQRIENIRQQHIPGRPPTSWGGKAIEVNGTRYSGSSLRTKLMLQVWLANVQYRVPEAMILDTADWEFTPEPADEYIDYSSVGLRKKKPEIVTNNNRMPWE